MKPLFPLKKNRIGSSGGGLIEIMLAMIILSILAIGGMSFAMYGTNGLNVYRKKLAALEIANNRLEELKARNYTSSAPSIQDYSVWYVKKAGNDWVEDGGGKLQFYESDQNETVSIGGVSEPVSTTVRYADKGGDATDSYDYLSVIVKVGYRPNSSGKVEIRTYMGPHV